MIGALLVAIAITGPVDLMGASYQRPGTITTHCMFTQGKVHSTIVYVPFELVDDLKVGDQFQYGTKIYSISGRSWRSGWRGTLELVLGLDPYSKPKPKQSHVTHYHRWFMGPYPPPPPLKYKIQAKGCGDRGSCK